MNRRTGHQSVEVAQQAPSLGNACGNIGFEIPRPQDLDHRRECDSTFDIAPSLDDADVVMGAGELGGQPALADAWVADDRHQPSRPRGDRFIKDALEPSHFVGPADERSVSGLRLAATALVHRDERRSTLHLNLAEGFVVVSAARRSPRLLADNDTAERALGLEPSSDVQRVADEVGIAGPHHDLTGVHRDSQRELNPMSFADPAGEVDELRLHLDRSFDSVSGVVGSDLGNTPYGHEAVADVLRDPHPVTIDGRPQEVVVAAHDIPRRFGVHTLFEAGRTRQVGEHHGHCLAGRTWDNLCRFL
jgi:hypothetical protein